MHVTHNLRPFVNKIRYAPEVASRPERLEKDLQNVKVLAGILEQQAASLRALKLADLKSTSTAKPEGEDAKPTQSDADMNSPEEEDPEPKESGSDAVERRVEKVLSDLREQGLVDVNDEKAYEEKKVRRYLFLYISFVSNYSAARQVVVSLDMYLDYLRAAFNTCYYCAVVSDHVEELQRKCLKHERKPLSKMMLEELKAAEAEKEKKTKVEDKEMADETGDDKVKVKEKDTRVAKNDPRDWKRNGLFFAFY